MSAAAELLTSGFSMGGKVKNAELASIAAGVKGGRYTRHGKSREANLAKAQAMLKWYTNSEAKGKEGGKAFQSRRNFSRYLATALARSPSPSPAGSRKSSRASSNNNSNSNSSRSRGSRASKRGVPTLVSAAGAPAKRTYTRKALAAPPASGQWPLLKKGDNIWSVKVVATSKSRAMVSKIYGKEGSKMSTTNDVITVGKAGRSPQQEALHIAEHAFEAKVGDGYTEVRSVHRGSNNELKSINNFKP
jgi:hypothetical protein